MTDTTAPYPGIPWLLERLARDGVRLGVVSNKKHDATQPLCRRFFGGLLGCALGARNDGERKPSPAMLLRAMELLDADAAHTVYVGDSDVDLQTAARPAFLLRGRLGLSDGRVPAGKRRRRRLRNRRRTLRAADGAFR